MPLFHEPRPVKLTIRFTIFLFVAVLAFTIGAHGENWPIWRGPTGQGISTEKNLPTHWSTNENVKWRVPLPDRGNSTPIVWNNRVFITQAIPAENKRVVLAFNRDDGKVLWQSGPTWTKPELTHDANPSSASSPATDGARVIAFFGSAGLYCFDFNGREIWHRDLGEQRHIWGYGSSPIIHGDTFYLNFGPGPRQLLIAIERKPAILFGKLIIRADIPANPPGTAIKNPNGSAPGPRHFDSCRGKEQLRFRLAGAATVQIQKRALKSGPVAGLIRSPTPRRFMPIESRSRWAASTGKISPSKSMAPAT